MEDTTTLGVRDGHMLSAINNLKVIDTVSGARLKLPNGLPNGDTVFTLIPRRYVIEKLNKVNLTIEALYALEDAQKKQKCEESKEYLLRKMMANTPLLG
jgi:hypothetical protein